MREKLVFHMKQRAQAVCVGEQTAGEGTMA